MELRRFLALAILAVPATASPIAAPKAPTDESPLFTQAGR